MAVVCGYVCMCARPHPADPKHPGHLDDAVVLLDAARDAAQFEGTPPAIGSPSTEVRAAHAWVGTVLTWQEAPA
jgi:hypothetical protein